MTRLIDADEIVYEETLRCAGRTGNSTTYYTDYHVWVGDIDDMPTVDAVPVPVGGIGELSDGYHTFNGLYYQRMMLFAVLVKTYKDRSWKSRRHSDGEPCFGGGWFIVGIDTPQGSYTYHYEDKYFNMFDCIELSKGKEWDGHTEDDVTRLLSLDAEPVRHGKWIDTNDGGICSMCKSGFKIYKKIRPLISFCPFCGAKMESENETD